MATYNGREVQVLRDPSPMDHQGVNHQKVVILTEDGEKTVNKGDVIIYSDDEVPMQKLTKDDRPLNDVELRVAHFKKATPKQIEQNNRRKADKQAKDARMLQYHKDGLTEEEIASEEKVFYMNRDKEEAAQRAAKVKQPAVTPTQSKPMTPAYPTPLAHPVTNVVDQRNRVM